MTDSIRVLIVDDQALLRGSLRVLIDCEADMDVVGEAGDGVEAVSLAGSLRPDVILMDVRMPGMDGIRATAEICATRETTGTRILILTTFDLDEYVYAGLRAGASGFLLKDASPADLLGAIRVVARGEALLAPSVTSRLIAEFARRPVLSEPLAYELAQLTDREREILTLVASGLSNDEMAGHLSLSQATIKTHMGHLLDKLRARDRAQLVIVAYETGLVTPSRG